MARELEPNLLLGCGISLHRRQDHIPIANCVKLE
jgi:hypothetical protein